MLLFLEGIKNNPVDIYLYKRTELHIYEFMLINNHWLYSLIFFMSFYLFIIILFS